MYYGTTYKPHPISGLILHIDSVQATGKENLPIADGLALMRAIDTTDAVAVMFAPRWMPRQAVPIEQVTDAVLQKLFNPPCSCDERSDIAGGDDFADLLET